MNPKLARKITTRLAESGQPPERGVSEFNVGTESLLETLDREYLTTILAEDGGSTFKLVEATYGGGKTHFLRCLQDIAWKRNFAVSQVELDQNECPYDNPFLVYKAVVRGITTPPKSDDDDPEAGLQPFLHNVAYDLHERFKGSKDPAMELEAWLASFRSADIESTVFRDAMHGALKAALADDTEKFSLLVGWMLGEGPPLKRVRDAIGVGEKLDKNNAFLMMRSLCQAVRAIGYSGIVIMFDEGYRMVSLQSSKKQKEACENLVSVINYCGHQKLPGSMFIYAVPPNFRTDVAPRYDALRQRIEAGKTLSPESPMSPVINLETLQIEPVEMLERVGEKLLPIVGQARNHVFDSDLQMKNIRAIAKEAVEQSLDVNSRRIFVKALVENLIAQAQAGERPLASGEVEERVRDTNKLLQGTAAGGEY